MTMKIGENAGKVFEYLRGQGKVSLNQIVKGTNLKIKEADRALGWLAREGKIRIEQGKKEETITLSE
jgi:predicted transcriptional regulator